MAMSEDQMYRALASAVSFNPAANLQEIARSAGMSKATLYRFAHSREALLEDLRGEGVRRTRRLYENAALETTPPLEAITRLAESMLTEREFCAFLITDYEVTVKASIEKHEALIAEWTRLETQVENVFLRGQREGIFRVELPASWLTDVFHYFLYGIVDSERRGRLAPANMLKLWQTTFMYGACTPSRDVRTV